MATNYPEQWKDPRWQRKRLEAMNRADWKCENCDDKETTLNVHHKLYIKGRMVWEYELHELAVLCEPCHQEEHADRGVLNQLLAEAGIASLKQTIALVAGYLNANAVVHPGTAYMAREQSEPFYEIGLAAAALEYLGATVTRELVHRVVKAHPELPMKTFLSAIDEWDDEGR